MKSHLGVVVLLAVVAGLAVGCASTSKRIKDLRLGMSPDEVEDELGAPHTIRAAKVYEDEQWTEIWEYLPPIVSAYPKTFWVFFENGRVVQWGEPGDFNSSPKSVKEYLEKKAGR